MNYTNIGIFIFSILGFLSCRDNKIDISNDAQPNVIIRIY